MPFYNLHVKLNDYSIFVLDQKTLRNTYRRVGTEVVQLARSVLNKSRGSGRVYYSPRRIASAPGQAPAKITGALLGGLKASLVEGDPGTAGGKRRAVLGVRIKDKIFYAKFLEAGAKGGGVGTGKHKKGRRNFVASRTSRVLEPRPFISTAVNMRRASIEKRLIDAFVHGIRFERVKVGK